MIKEYLIKIEKDLDVRQNLIELRKLLKTEQGKKEWNLIQRNYFQLLTELLQHADAKVRKNAALILGETGAQQALQQLFEAYREEKQLFVRGAYLTAMSNLDYRPYLRVFEERIQEIMNTVMTPENQKHLNEELKLLREMLLTMEAPKKHRFTGFSVPSELILLTSPGFEQLTVDGMPAACQRTAHIMNGGVRVMTERPGALMELRTVKGILFRFCKNPLASNDYRTVAAAIMEAGLLEYLQKRHEGQTPFYFRIDLRTRLVLNEKSQYVKRLAGELERLSEHRLQNSASNYECELRITENKQGLYSVYLVLHTFPDTRFAYRRNALATSMHPVRAAEIVALADEYLAEEATVLDPFCGTGTLLIERYRRKKAANLYGVDIYGKAIELGRENAQLAHVPVYFINRDFKDFTHSYQFDEIITEFPARSDKMTSDMLYELYKTFIGKLQGWMKDAGQVIVCTTEEEWLSRLAAKSGYLKMEAVYHLSGKRETALVIMKYRG
ncbi:MAG: methyltransferase domain-containing protein [Coprococcus sp.]